MTKVGLFIKESKEAAQSAKRLIQALRQHSAEPLLLTQQAKLVGFSRYGVSESTFLSQIALLIAVGGDGTILHAARLSAPQGTPLLGVNLGRLGFLSEVDLMGALRAVGKILKGQYREDTRMMIEAIVSRKGRAVSSTLALNDVVLGKTGISRLIHLECYLHRSLIATYEADGLIVSTPTGSTGYSLSAGGPLLYPHLKQVSITAIAPHTVGSRPIIVGGETGGEPWEIRVILSDTPAGLECVLTADGQNMIKLKKGDEIIVSESPYHTIFVRLGPYDFMKVVRKKLGWGRR